MKKLFCFVMLLWLPSLSLSITPQQEQCEAWGEAYLAYHDDTKVWGIYPVAGGRFDGSAVIPIFDNDKSDIDHDLTIDITDRPLIVGGRVQGYWWLYSYLEHYRLLLAPLLEGRPMLVSELGQMTGFCAASKEIRPYRALDRELTSSATAPCQSALYYEYHKTEEWWGVTCQGCATLSMFQFAQIVTFPYGGDFMQEFFTLVERSKKWDPAAKSKIMWADYAPGCGGP